MKLSTKNKTNLSNTEIKKKNLEALKFVEDIEKSGTDYMDIINSQIIDLKNVQEPKEESIIKLN